MKITNSIFIIKREFWWEHPCMMLQGLASMLDGLILVSSFGFCIPSFAVDVCRWRTKKWHKKMVAKHKKII